MSLCNVKKKLLFIRNSDSYTDMYLGAGEPDLFNHKFRLSRETLDPNQCF